MQTNTKLPLQYSCHMLENTVQGDEWIKRIPLRSYLQDNFDGRDLLTQFMSTIGPRDLFVVI